MPRLVVVINRHDSRESSAYRRRVKAVPNAVSNSRRAAPGGPRNGAQVVQERSVGPSDARN